MKVCRAEGKGGKGNGDCNDRRSEAGCLRDKKS